MLGDFNARVGRSVQIDDVIGMFGEDMHNASGNILLSFLNEVELMICNGRKLVSEPEWTRVRPSLKQKSIIDYIITDAQLLEVSGNVHVDRTDIGSSDHFLVWMELGRATKTSKKKKRVIRWCLDRFGDDEVKLSYQNALRAEVHRFSENIRSKVERGTKGQELVNEVVMKWESVVNRVAKCELGEKMIVCGRAARWWDEQIKDRINARREVYRKVVNGPEDLWDEYCRLRKEIKQLVIEKKLNIWNELVEKVNTDFDENRKEFWAFVGRKTKGKKKNIASLKSDTGMSITSTRGKLEVLQKHYQLLNENVAYKRGGALPKKMADPEIIKVKAIVSALATCMLYTGHEHPRVNEADIRYTFHYTATCAMCVIARLYCAIVAWRLDHRNARVVPMVWMGRGNTNLTLKSSSGLLRRRRLSSGDFPRSVTC